MNIHPNARTTPKIRAEIKESTLTTTQKAEKHNIGFKTAKKWETREETTDKSHRPNKLQT
jgi:hypothetical protein